MDMDAKLTKYSMLFLNVITIISTPGSTCDSGCNLVLGIAV